MSLTMMVLAPGHIAHRPHSPVWTAFSQQVQLLAVFSDTNSYPVAPPRLLGGDLVDTVSKYSTSYRVLQPPSLVNKYAALPSLHVGWNLLVGVFVWRNASTPLMRTLGGVSPALMITAVVLTANHYIVDAVAGSGLAPFGLWIAGQLGAVVKTSQVEPPKLSRCLTPSR